MATVNLGSIKFKWKGTYAGGTAYTIDDVVSYNGSSYICIQASTGNLPTNATYFEQMSSAGTNGTDGTDLTTTLTTQGDIVYRDASGLVRLGAGTSGQALITQGTGANPIWGSAGGIKQVIQGTFTGTTAITGNSTQDFQDSGLNATITPSSTSSKILIMAVSDVGATAGQRSAGVLAKVVGGTTTILPIRADSAGSRQRGFMTMNNTSDYNHMSWAMNYLDSPSTTSAITYKMQGWCEGLSNMYFNRDRTDTDSTTWIRGASQITLMEVTV